MSNLSGNSGNKFMKQQNPQAGYQTSNPMPYGPVNVNNNERLMWEMRNVQMHYRHHNQYYRNRTPNTTPSSTVLNSPDLNDIDDLKFMEQYQNLNQQIKAAGFVDDSNNTVSSNNENLLDSQPMKSAIPTHSNNNINNNISMEGDDTFDDLDQKNMASNWMQQQNINSSSLLALSPTSSQSSSNSTHVQAIPSDNSRNRVIGGLHIADLQGSPRRFGNLQNTPTEQSQPQIGTLTVKPAASQQSTGAGLKMSVSPNNYPKRPPGFPKRIISPKESKNSINSEKLEEICMDEKTPQEQPPFDYLYEFSETRKVLEEFFTPQQQQQLQQQQLLQFQQQTKRQQAQQLLPLDDLVDFDDPQSPSYIEQQLAVLKQQQQQYEHQLQQQYENRNIIKQPKDNDLYLVDSGENSRSSCCEGDMEDDNLNSNNNFSNSNNKKNQPYYDDLEAQNYYISNIQQSKNFTLSPETTDYDSNCGDLDSEISLKYDFSLTNDLSGVQDTGRLYSSMPVLEDGLSSGHASESEMENKGQGAQKLTSGISSIQTSLYANYKEKPTITENYNMKSATLNEDDLECQDQPISPPPLFDQQKIQLNVETPSVSNSPANKGPDDIQSALKDIRATLQRTKTLTNNINDTIGTTSGTSPICSHNQNEPEIVVSNVPKIGVTTQTNEDTSPVWVPRNSLNNQTNLNHHSKESINSSLATGDNQNTKLFSGDEEEADTDLETDRLLGQQRLEEQQIFDDNKNFRKIRCANGQIIRSPAVKTQTSIRHGIGTQALSSPILGAATNDSTGNQIDDCDDSALNNQLASPTKLLSVKTKSPSNSLNSRGKDFKKNRGCKNKEGMLDPAVLIEGVLFRARYLGSTQLVCEGQPTKSTRMMQAEEAVSRIKAPEGESQPSTEVDLFISTEKIMVLNTDLKEIMMDHALRTISYIADIGDLVVLMARRRFVPQPQVESDGNDNGGTDTTPPTSSNKVNRTPKMICHVFESEEAQFIAQSIGQAFQVAYMEFLKANGIEDHSFMKEMDYQEVLNSQEIFGDELEIFAKKELQKEVVVPKAKGEILGVVIVESGWGSMLPTVVIANLASNGAATRCGQLNIGDQIIAINGLSLVGLPLSQCQTYIKNTKNQTAVKFTVVPCAPVVEVKIKRPNTKYQLGFSVQNGVICSLLRGGIAERGGVRVGHRIIEINNQSVVAVPHEKIVNLLATSVGEILMKTMPTSMFRLLTGQENPIYI